MTFFISCSLGSISSVSNHPHEVPWIILLFSFFCFVSLQHSSKFGFGMNSWLKFQSINWLHLDTFHDLVSWDNTLGEKILPADEMPFPLDLVLIVEPIKESWDKGFLRSCFTCQYERKIKLCQHEYTIAILNNGFFFKCRWDGMTILN